MKYSEAMRKGIKLSRRAEGTMAEMKDGHLCTCAMGAIALGKNPRCKNIDVLDHKAELLGELDELDRKVKHPLREEERSIYGVIISLNDTFGWSRGKIANWLAKQGL